MYLDMREKPEEEGAKCRVLLLSKMQPLSVDEPEGVWSAQDQDEEDDEAATKTVAVSGARDEEAGTKNRNMVISAGVSTSVEGFGRPPSQSIPREEYTTRAAFGRILYSGCLPTR